MRFSANYVSLHRKLQNDWYMEIKVFRRKLYDKMLQWKTERGGKVYPIEVKSSGYKNHASLDAFLRKYPDRVGKGYLLYTKDLRKDGSTLFVPAFMTMFISKLAKSSEKTKIW